MHFSKETMLILGIHHAKDTASKEYLDVKNFLLSLTKKYTFLTSIYISHNTHKADIALGDLEHMYGKETITELLN
jgi:hypothetical protein